MNSCDRHSNEYIIRTATSDFAKYKISLLSLRDSCEMLALTNQATEMELYYRKGRASIWVGLKSKNSNQTFFSKEEPKRMVDSSLLFRKKSFQASYKKNEFLRIPIGLRNNKFKYSHLIYTYNQSLIINQYYKDLKKFNEITSIPETDSGMIYFIDKDWMIVIQ